MFKIFQGYQLVEAYHKWKKSHKRDDKTVSRAIRLVIAVLAAVLVWCLPVETWIDGMTIIQKRTLAIFLFAILMWLFEAVPAWTTSVMVVVLLLFATSNSSLVLFNNGVDVDTLKSYNGLPANAKKMLDNRDEYGNVLDYLSTADSLAIVDLKDAVKKVNAGGEQAIGQLLEPTDSLPASVARVELNDTLSAILTPSTIKLLDDKTIDALTPAVIENIPAPVVGEIKALGKQSSYKSLLACFADPIIMLFIGGFILAIAASKTGLDLSSLSERTLSSFSSASSW